MEYIYIISGNYVVFAETPEKCGFLEYVKPKGLALASHRIKEG